MPKQQKSSAPNPRVYILRAGAGFNFGISYVVLPANPEYTTQAAHMECLETIDVSLQ